MRKQNRNIIKPLNITKDNSVYKQFLQLLDKLKKKRDFSSNDLTVEEVEKCISPFYKSNLTTKRLVGYHMWVQTNLPKILVDLKNFKKSGKVESPDNAEKTMIFNKFSEVIKKLSKSNKFENVMENPELIAAKIYSGSEAKKKVAYVKKYIKEHFGNLKKSYVDDTSSEGSESDDENNSTSDKDQDSSDIQQRKTDTDDSSVNSSFDEKLVRDLPSTVVRSTPKHLEVPSSTLRSPIDKISIKKRIRMTSEDVDPIKRPTKTSKRKLSQSIDSGLDATKRISTSSPYYQSTKIARGNNHKHDSMSAQRNASSKHRNNRSISVDESIAFSSGQENSGSLEIGHITFLDDDQAKENTTWNSHNK